MAIPSSSVATNRQAGQQPLDAAFSGNRALATPPPTARSAPRALETLEGHSGRRQTSHGPYNDSPCGNGDFSVDARAPKLNNSTHAARNPARPVIPPRTKRKPVTEAHKASQKIATAAARLKRKELDADIKVYLEDQALKISALAAKHHVEDAQVLQKVGMATHYKTTRAVSLSNAITHAKAKAINSQLPVGEKKKLAELKQLASQDNAMQNLSEDDKARLIAELVEYRKLKTTGARSSNQAAAKDFLGTADRVNGELDSLAQRTGARAITLMVRGHINDECAPTWHATNEAIDFFVDALGLELDDVVRLFEQWACAPNKSSKDAKTLENLRKKCVKAIQEGLRIITSRNTARMSYVKYDDLVQAHCVQLEGWPLKKFVNPSFIGTVSEIRDLWNALDSGACQWKRLTSSEMKAYKETILKRLDLGETVAPKARQVRKDKGVPRKRKQAHNSEDDEPSDSTLELEDRPRRASKKAKTSSTAASSRATKAPRTTAKPKGDPKIARASEKARAMRKAQEVFIENHRRRKQARSRSVVEDSDDE
ncbi:hypothetical protein PLICRDRAFT_154292 [Plicaturopsis crispa FD-325 SS-3]|nr:hypothetical protein PLICRDRAFT_154292 [Plicaturopsis crispa FD-325 SS-3]